MPDAKKSVICEFVIPLVRDGDRSPHQPSAWSALHDALFRCFDGFMGPQAVYRIRDGTPGQYRSETKGRVEDECRQYRIGMPRDRVDELRALLRKAANTFDQEEIFLVILEGDMDFLSATEEDGYLTDLDEE